MQDDGGKDHARNAHQLFAEHQPDECQPHRTFDAVADDLAVEEIFQLVDDDEEDQCDERHLRRDRERHADDEDVADEDQEESAEEETKA